MASVTRHPVSYYRESLRLAEEMYAMARRVHNRHEEMRITASILSDMARLSDRLRARLIEAKLNAPAHQQDEQTGGGR